MILKNSHIETEEENAILRAYIKQDVEELTTVVDGEIERAVKDSEQFWSDGMKQIRTHIKAGDSDRALGIISDYIGPDTEEK